MLFFVASLLQGCCSSFLFAICLLELSPLPRRFGTARHGQPGQPRAGHSTGDSLGAVPEIRPSWGFSRVPHGFLPVLGGGSPVLQCAFVRLSCGFTAGILLGSSWVLSPVPRLFPLQGVHFRPFPTIRVWGYSLPPSVLSALRGRGVAWVWLFTVCCCKFIPPIHFPLWRGFRLCQIPPQVGGSLCSLVVRSLFDCRMTFVQPLFVAGFSRFVHGSMGDSRASLGLRPSFAGITCGYSDRPETMRT